MYRQRNKAGKNRGIKHMAASKRLAALLRCAQSDVRAYLARILSARNRSNIGVFSR